MTQSVEMCRICFKTSTPTNQHKWMDLDTFVPIIQLLARTQVFSCDGSPRRICGSCANGLIMANMFRVKVIESNAICRNLFVKEEIDIEEDHLCEVKQDLEVPVSQADESMYEEHLDESFLKTIERQTETKIFIPREKLNRLKYLPFSKNYVKQRPCKPEVFCCLCGQEVTCPYPDEVRHYSDTLSKLVPQNDADGHVCKDCLVNIKNANNHFHQMEQPPPPNMNSTKYYPCQFCYRRCRQVNHASIDMVTTFMSLPQPMDHRNVLVGGRSCAMCIKNLGSLGELMKRLTKGETHKSKLMKREATTFEDIVSLDDTLEDYQCHMSEIEDSDSDSSLPELLFGEPFNTPFMQQRFKCPICIHTFVDRQKLEAHIVINHQTPSNVCDICNHRFNSIQVCKQHKCRVHFSAVYDGYYKKLCEFCGLSTKQLEPHLYTHTNLKPFLCDLCGHRSRSKVRITDHILAMHTNERRYKCSYCDKGFSYHADKNRHEISTHTKQYKYVCEICKKCFLKKNFLKAHQDTHEGVFLKQIG